jgi:hypothetical protein
LRIGFGFFNFLVSSDVSHKKFFWVLGLGIKFFGFWVWVLGLGIKIFGFWVLGFGFWVLGFGFWVQQFLGIGFGYWV